MQPKTSLKNILTVDVEDWFHILEIPSFLPLQTWLDLESRVVSNTLLVLDLLDNYQTKGTFFILGWVAENFPDLIREIDKRGHEIGTHGYSHELVHNLTPDRFRRDVCLSLEHLSSLTSRQIFGYRAPGFSISSSTLWALDILLELGFSYDASIFPMKRNHGGFPEFSANNNWIVTPQGNRILEIPVTSMINCFGKKVYLFGGGYFRITPYSIVRQAMSYLNEQGKQVLVYIHPREFDAKQPRLKMNLNRAFMTYVNLNKTQAKFESILQEFSFNSIENIWNLSLTKDCLAA
jgi:polysaccharide deacetylase family protein (PEP-CTERM system associated)